LRWSPPGHRGRSGCHLAGAQQALDLVARVLVEPGDVVVCGQADYLGLLGVLSDHGAVAHPIPIDDAGLDVDRLETELRSGLRPRACYLVPHHHNPTGATIAPERRVDLHRLSARYGFVVIEDDPYRALTYTGPEPVEAAADPDLTVRIRSTSKVLTPGLRIGALAGPRWLTEAVVIQKQSADLHTSSLSQALVVAALDTGFLDDHVAGLRADYRAKLDILIEAVEHRLGDRVALERPGGGMFLWVRFPGIDTGQLLERAIDHRVCFVPGEAFAVGTDLSDRARLSFVTASPDELVDGVDRLAAALADADSAGASGPTREAAPAVAGIGS
ncbi:MAG: PLP-dependent aminotransferase family protein, partial [Actinomycetota bacterium]